MQSLRYELNQRTPRYWDVPIFWADRLRSMVSRFQIFESLLLMLLNEPTSIQFQLTNNSSHRVSWWPPLVLLPNLILVRLHHRPPFLLHIYHRLWVDIEARVPIQSPSCYNKPNKSWWVVSVVWKHTYWWRDVASSRVVNMKLKPHAFQTQGQFIFVV